MMHREINDMSKDTLEAFPRFPEHPVTEVKWLLNIQNILGEITSCLKN